MDTNDNDIKEFETVLGYSFKNPKLLIQALTHSSYTNETSNGKKDHSDANNERLEFLGDAVLELAVSDYIFKSYPDLSEGEMTKLRASVVCEASLAEASKEMEIGRRFHMGKGEERTGGRERDSILADGFEAVAGAIFTDGGFEHARNYILKKLKTQLKDNRTSFMNSDYKTSLQEAVQSYSKEPLEYTVIDEVGPAHNRTFVVKLTHENKTLATGQGKSKKEAEQNCAKQALKIIDC